MFKFIAVTLYYSSNSAIRAAFVLGQSDSARVSTFHVVSCMALPLTIYEPEVCLKASRSAQRGEPRLTAPGCWQLALAVSSPQSHRHVALEELIIPRCSGLPSDHLG